MKNDTTLSLHFLNLKPDQQDALRQLPQTLLDTLKSNNITPPSCIQLTQETSDGYTAHLFVREETLQELESDLKTLDESQVHKKYGPNFVTFFTAIFPDGNQADIRVCTDSDRDSNQLWTEAILVNTSGVEIDCTDTEEGLLSIE